jgi:hypothetical protein
MDSRTELRGDVSGFLLSAIARMRLPVHGRDQRVTRSNGAGLFRAKRKALSAVTWSVSACMGLNWDSK